MQRSLLSLFQFENISEQQRKLRIFKIKIKTKNDKFIFKPNLTIK